MCVQLLAPFPPTPTVVLIELPGYPFFHSLTASVPYLEKGESARASLLNPHPPPMENSQPGSKDSVAMSDPIERLRRLTLTPTDGQRAFGELWIVASTVALGVAAIGSATLRRQLLFGGLSLGRHWRYPEILIL